MNNPKDFKLPSFEAASFESSYWHWPPNADPAFVLRYFRDDLIQPAISEYLRYSAKLSSLQADAAKAKADFHAALVKMQG